MVDMWYFSVISTIFPLLIVISNFLRDIVRNFVADGWLPLIFFLCKNKDKFGYAIADVVYLVCPN